MFIYSFYDILILKIRTVLKVPFYIKAKSSKGKTDIFSFELLILKTSFFPFIIF